MTDEQGRRRRHDVEADQLRRDLARRDAIIRTLVAHTRRLDRVAAEAGSATDALRRYLDEPPLRATLLEAESILRESPAGKSSTSHDPASGGDDREAMIGRIMAAFGSRPDLPDSVEWVDGMKDAWAGLVKDRG